MEVPFGFMAGGWVRLEVRKVQLKQNYHKGDGNLAKTFDTEKIGFYITTLTTLEQVEVEMEAQGCMVQDGQYVRPIITFNSPTITEVIDGKRPNATAEVQVKQAGKYMLLFANCDRSAEVSFHVDVEMFNLNGGEKNYLSVGEQELPSMYLSMFLAFCAIGVAWVYMCVKEKQNVHSIHYLMFLLIALRALTLFTQFGMYHFDAVTGDPDGWNIAYYIFTFFRGVMFFTVVVLIGTGWSYLRPFIGEQEKKILVVVIPLQVVANIAIVVLDETSPIRASWVTWQDMLHLVDIICCCAILFPIVWSIKHLREGAETDGKAAANIEKLTLFRQFYILVVIYIYFTRIIVFMLEGMLPYDMKWVAAFTSEMATLAFYVITGLKFQPHQDNKYLRLSADTV